MMMETLDTIVCSCVQSRIAGELVASDRDAANDGQSRMYTPQVAMGQI